MILIRKFVFSYNCRVFSSSWTFNCSATKARPSEGVGCPDSTMWAFKNISIDSSFETYQQRAQTYEKTKSKSTWILQWEKTYAEQSKLLYFKYSRISSLIRRFSCGIRGFTSVGSCNVEKISARSFARVAPNDPFCSNVCLTTDRRSSNVLMFNLKTDEFNEIWDHYELLVLYYDFHHRFFSEPFYKINLSFSMKPISETNQVLGSVWNYWNS